MLCNAGPYGSPMGAVTMTIGINAANVSWTQPDSNLQNGIITYYTVVLTDITFGMPDRAYNTTLTTFSFTGLEEYVTYSYAVAAATIGGLGPFSAPVQFTTQEDSKNIVVYFTIFC